MNPSYSHSEVDFVSADLYDSKLDMSDSRAGDMNFFSFDHDHHADPNSLSAFEMPISPTMSGNDMYFNNSARPMHIDPTATWNESEKARMTRNFNMNAVENIPGMAQLLTDYTGQDSRSYGQITPPSEDGDNASSDHAGKRADSGIGHKPSSQPVRNAASQSSSDSSATRRTMSARGRPSKRVRKDSQISEEGDQEVAESAPGDGKREKYREKNRVAAAKCRAKKKNSVDNLEDTHRTQSVLNTALKQTEKTLRDELSFWRTQALQHTFCNCRPIQDYNMRKARHLAAESMARDNHTPDTRNTNSLSITPPTASSSGTLPRRSQSVAGMGTEVASPATSSAGPVLDPAAGRSSLGERSRRQDASRRPSENTTCAPMISRSAEQELISFVGDGR